MVPFNRNIVKENMKDNKKFSDITWFVLVFILFVGITVTYSGCKSVQVNEDNVEHNIKRNDRR